MKFGLFEVDAIGDDDDLSHVYLPNFKQLWLGVPDELERNQKVYTPK